MFTSAVRSFFVIGSIIGIEVVASTASAKLTAGEMTIANLRTLAASVSSKEAFLRELPDECKKFYLLVYSSRATPCSSFESPRLLTSCDLSSARIVIAIDGQGAGLSPEQCQKVEILEQLKEGPLQSAEIDFHPARRTEGLKEDPSRCLSCHGSPLKHLGDQYPNWPGFYESSLRNMKIGTEEYQGYQRYKATRERDTLYQQLLPYDEDVGQHDPATYISFRVHGDLDRYASTFFNALGRANDARSGHLLEKHPRFGAFRFALAAAANDCPDIASFLPESLQASGRSLAVIQAETQTGIHRADTRVVSQVRRQNDPEASVFDLDYSSRLFTFLYLTERMGLDPQLFSTTLHRGEITFPRSSFSPLQWLITDYGWELGPEGKGLRQWLKDHQGERLCAELKTASQEQFGVPLKAAPKVLHRPVAGFATQSCVECHVSAVSVAMGAPQIPFDTDDKFRPWLQANPRFRQKMRSRVSTENEWRMPPIEHLGPEEKGAILRLLDSAGG